MKFIPINNNPNVSETRYYSVSPSLQLDSQKYPCISWLSKKNGHNEINYKYWDGSNWSYYDSPIISRVKDDIQYAPNALSLLNDTPSVVFAKKDINGNNILACATAYFGSWEIDELLVDYDPLWVGTLAFDWYSGSSSSSDSGLYSSSSSSESLSSNMNSLSSLSESSLYSPSSSSKSSESILNFSSSSSERFSSSSIGYSSNSSSSSSSIGYSSSSIGYSSISNSSSSSSSSSSSVDSSSSSSVDSSSSIDSSSSSSSSLSLALTTNIIVVYSYKKIDIYAHTSSGEWIWMNSKVLVEEIEDLSMLKIVLCGQKIGIVYYNGSYLRYNFFDAVTNSWQFTLFDDLVVSASANIVDFSICGQFANPFSYIHLAWTINNTTSTLLKYAKVNHNNTIVSSTVETQSSIITPSTGFMPNGYTKIGICLNSTGLPKIFATGAISAMFSNNGINWSKSTVDISGSTTFVPDSISIINDETNDLSKISLCNNGNDILYFVESTNAGFDEYFPQISVLSEKRLYISDWTSGILNGSQVSGAYRTTAFDILRECQNKVGVFISEYEDPFINTSSSSSSIDSSSSEGISSSSSSEGISSNSSSSSEQNSSSSSSSGDRGIGFMIIGSTFVVG